MASALARSLQMPGVSGVESNTILFQFGRHDPPELLIPETHVLVIATDEDVDSQRLVGARSSTADLVILGFTEARLDQKARQLFERFPDLRDALFVSAEETIFLE